MFLVGRVAGWYSKRARQVQAQQRLVEVVAKHGGQYYYDYQINERGEVDTKATTKNFVARCFGTHWGHDIVYVSLAAFTNRDTESAGTVDDEVLRIVGKCRSLRWLALSGTDVSPEGVTAAVSKLKLEKLWLGQTRINDQTLADISNSKSLQFLSIEGTPTSDVGVRSLTKLPELEFLALGSPQIGEVGLLALADAKKLRELHLDLSFVTDRVLRRIGALERLELLSIRRTRVTTQGLRLLKSDSLKTLHLDGTSIQDGGLEKIAERLPNLEVLSIEKTQIDDDGIANLSGCKKLRKLNTAGTNCSVRATYELFAHGLGWSPTEAWNAFAITKVDENNKVLSLSLDSLNFSDADVATLGVLKDLKTLSLRENSLTDAGVEKLTALGLDSLRVLILNGASLTDAALPELAKFSSLANLHIANTNATINAVEELNQRLPSVTIYTTDLRARQRIVREPSQYQSP